jgi:hypothetical protein
VSLRIATRLSCARVLAAQRHASTLACIWLLFACHSASAARAQSASGFLRITPSSVIISTDESPTFDVVDESGRPVADASWSLSEPIAEIVPDNPYVKIQPRNKGRAILTATADGLSATAVISIVDLQDIKSGTIHWAVNPWPGYESLFVRQTEKSENGPDLMDVEWSKTAPAIVRGLRDDGRQIWLAHLSSLVSPETLKRKTLPPMGKTVWQNEPQNYIRDILLRDGGGFFAARATDAQIAAVFPSPGQTIFIYDCGDHFGGLLFLERGATSDSLVELGADGNEAWRYRSQGRLTDSWTVNYDGDVGIVETLPAAPASGLLIVSGTTGAVRFRIPFPSSSTTLTHLKCEPQNTISTVRPSQSGSPLTSVDGNIYLQVVTHNETANSACPSASYTFDNVLSLLQVTPEGSATWRIISQIHSDSAGEYKAQARLFAGETIPDGLGGVLAAWTYFSPGNLEGEKPHSEPRVSRLGPSDQSDFTLPMPDWETNPAAIFDVNMVLGDDDILFATNGHYLVKFHIPTGQVKWIRQAPTGTVELQFAARGGGVLVSNAGQLVLFDADGNGARLPWSVDLPGNSADIGIAQVNEFDQTAEAPLALRDVQLYMDGNFLSVEDGPPAGQGRVMMFTNR